MELWQACLLVYFSVGLGGWLSRAADQQLRPPSIWDWLAMFTIGPTIMVYAACVRFWIYFRHHV
jgi:predicted DNA repair protein MutK